MKQRPIPPGSWPLPADDPNHPRATSLPLTPLAEDYNAQCTRLVQNIRNLARMADLLPPDSTPDAYNVIADLNYRLERAIARLSADKGLPGIQQRIPNRPRAPKQPK
jgi:hypothetical protein